LIDADALAFGWKKSNIADWVSPASPASLKRNTGGDEVALVCGRADLRGEKIGLVFRLADLDFFRLALGGLELNVFVWNLATVLKS